MHQKIGIVTFLIFIPLIAFSQDLLIVEVQVRGTSPSESYIKIYNQGKELKDISGYKLIKKSSTGKEYSIRVFPKGSFILPREYFLWANSKNDYHFSVNADIYSTAEISSNNSIALLADDRKLIDSLTWGEGKNQFALEKPFPFNPQEKELIKRTYQDGFYKNTENNGDDFYLFSEKEPIQLTQQEMASSLKKENPLPVKEGISIAVALATLSVFLKRKLIN